MNKEDLLNKLEQMKHERAVIALKYDGAIELLELLIGEMNDKEDTKPTSFEYDISEFDIGA